MHFCSDIQQAYQMVIWMKKNTFSLYVQKKARKKCSIILGTWTRPNPKQFLFVGIDLFMVMVIIEINLVLVLLGVWVWLQ